MAEILIGKCRSKTITSRVKPMKINKGHYLARIMSTLLARKILHRVVFQNGCWVWQGCRDRKGYGKIHYNNRSQWVHRITYALFVGDIEEGLVIHHTCFNSQCCNPAHLEKVSRNENSRRKSCAF